MKTLTLRVREGKRGRDGIVFINDECAAVIKRYLLIRLAFGNRWQTSLVLYGLWAAMDQARPAYDIHRIQEKGRDTETGQYSRVQQTHLPPSWLQMAVISNSKGGSLA